MTQERKKLHTADKMQVTLKKNSPQNQVLLGQSPHLQHKSLILFFLWLLAPPCPKAIQQAKAQFSSYNLMPIFKAYTFSRTSATAPIICSAPSFCLESTLGVVSTDMQKPIALLRTSLRLAVAVWNTVCAAITGERKSSNTSVHTKRVG